MVILYCILEPKTISKLIDRKLICKNLDNWLKAQDFF